MEKVIEIIISTLILSYIFTNNENLFSSSNKVTLFLTLFIFNLFFDIMNYMRQMKPIKVSLLKDNLKQTGFAFVTFYLVHDLLTPIMEMQTNTKNIFIALIIAIVTKHSNKYYNFSHF
jgi:hypothetical protein